MATLHIEHKIRDFVTWKAAFDRIAGQRREAGVTTCRIYQPHDDAADVVLQLDFPSIPQAQRLVDAGEFSRSCGKPPCPCLGGRFGIAKNILPLCRSLHVGGLNGCMTF